MRSPVQSCIVVLALASTTAGADDTLDRLRRYHDSDYVGALDARGVALASALARQIGESLAGPAEPCASPDLRAGTLAGRIGKADMADDADHVTNALRALVDAAGKLRREQQAVALRAIGFLGTRARAAAPLLETLPSPWARAALSKLTCDRWSPGTLEELVPPSALPKPDEWSSVLGRLEDFAPPQPDRNRSCDATRALWLWRQALDAHRSWPEGFIESNWSEIAASDCPPLPLAHDEATLLRDLLDDPSMAASRKQTWLTMLPAFGTNAAPLADALALQARSPDESLAFSAQAALVATGTEAGARAFVDWLDRMHVFNWAWGDTRQLAPHARIVLPALERELDDDVFSNRAAAAKVIGELADPAGVGILQRHGLKANDWPTAQAAVNALARLAKTETSARGVLRDVASTYWSGRVRAVAQVASTGGRGIEGDPFGCGLTPEQTLARQIEQGRKGNTQQNDTGAAGETLSCIQFCYSCTVEHKLPDCGTTHGHGGTFATAGGRTHRIRWTLPHRQRPPRVSPGDLSSWCSDVGSVSILDVDGGWLAGCFGFEGDGALAFVPAQGDARAIPIREMGVTALVEWRHRYFAAGSSPFEFGDAGALYELVRVGASEWKTVPIAALPSVPTGAATTPAGIAFADEEAAVLVDPVKASLQPLDCTR